DSSENNLVFDYDSLQKKKSKKTELIYINDEEQDSYDSNTDDINEYKKQEIDYDNEYNS
ncbi:7345_t:CDS:1, partial [Funneliformis mosseae]